MLAFPLREVRLFAKVAISDPVTANPVTGHQESFSSVCTSVGGILSTSWPFQRPMTKEKYSLHCMRIWLWLTKLEKGEGRVNGGRKSEEILINMKTPYPRFTDSFQLLNWAVGLAQSSLPSPLQPYSSLSSFPSLFWATAQPVNMKYILTSPIQGFWYVRPWCSLYALILMVGCIDHPRQGHLK